MPTKRYRLLQNHPYAEKGTIVEEEYNNGCVLFLKLYGSQLHYVHDISVPLNVEKTWLEEVKDEVMFTPEQANAIREQIKAGKELSFNSWLSKHTAKEE